MATQYRVEYHHSSDTHWLVESEVPDWAIWVSELSDRLDHATGHVLCGLFYSSFGRMLFCGDNRAREVQRTAISPDLARRLGRTVTEEEDESTGNYDGSAD